MKQSIRFFTQSLPRGFIGYAAKLFASLILAGMTLTTTSSQAAQLYISPTGSDSHPCTQALPCLTLQHAVDVALSSDTINIEAGTYTKSTTTIDSKNLTILGVGASHSILQGLGLGSFKSVMRMMFSIVRVSGVTISEGGASAIEIEGGSVILEDSIVSDSFGLPGVENVGGGITMLGGLLTVKGTTITNNNSEGGFGGGIVNNNGAVITIIRSTISGNSAGTGSGGGIANFNRNGIVGLIMLNQSTVSGNSASSGGGIFSGGGPVQVLNSTIAGNKASTNGGGIEADGSGVVELNNATVSENEANAGLSGGTGGGLNLSSGTILTASNTILALNLKEISVFPFVLLSDCGAGQLLSSGYNLFGFLGQCTLVGPGTDRTGVSPNLGPLQNNGGPTETLLPLTGSPAIDAGNPAGCTDPFGNKLTADQRGLPRPDADDVRCDIGAVEVQQ